MSIQDGVMYYTACSDCGLAVSNVRVPPDSDFLETRDIVACPDCYAIWRAAKDKEEASQNGAPAATEQVSVSA